METFRKTVKTCGKLYVGGEYSILKPYQSAILKNIDIFMTAEIYFNGKNEYELTSDMYNYSVSMEYDSNYSLIQDTISLMNNYILLQGKKILPFRLEISGKMEKEGKKYGIGSSGSVTALVIKAMCELYEMRISKDMLFKLSSYVLLRRGDNGSMGDLACIAYEKLILYTSFDREEIRKIIFSKSMEEALKEDWKYIIEEISSNKRYDFLVGWTGEPSISSDMIDRVKNRMDEEYFEKTQVHVLKLKKAIESGNEPEIKENIIGMGKLLLKLNSSIYSEKLKKLVDSLEGLNSCAKSSGAGGGDCGIAISFNEKDSRIIIERWKKLGIELLYSEKL